MGSKTGKRANKATAKASNAPVEKDDGTRWIVVRDGRAVYGGVGVTRAQAQHLCEGLQEPAELQQV